MFYVREVRICCARVIFEYRRGRLGSKISGYGQLAEVAVVYSPCPVYPGSRHQSEGSACPLGAATTGHRRKAAECPRAEPEARY